MTDDNTLENNNIKHFGKLSSNQVSCHQYPIDVDSESIPSCYDRVCLECVNDHSFRGNIIDLLPELFPEISKNNSSISINKL